VRRRRPAVEIARRPAGPDFCVVTVAGSGGPFVHCRKPCPECPWRRDAPRGAFPAEAYRLSARTAYDMAESAFSCHMAGSDAPSVCAGFLLRGADHNLSIRLRIIKGEYDPGRVSSDVLLYDDYRAMALANGVAAGDPALKPCR
jgi:hypothetical protein